MTSNYMANYPTSAIIRYCRWPYYLAAVVVRLRKVTLMPT